MLTHKNLDLRRDTNSLLFESPFPSISHQICFARRLCTFEFCTSFRRTVKKHELGAMLVNQVVFHKYETQFSYIRVFAIHSACRLFETIDNFFFCVEQLCVQSPIRHTLARSQGLSCSQRSVCLCCACETDAWYYTGVRLIGR